MTRYGSNRYTCSHGLGIEHSEEYPLYQVYHIEKKAAP